ncbi:S8 family serine peptidase [bacterium]|nr:S8 family serine peptidase [bacterium]
MNRLFFVMGIAALFVVTGCGKGVNSSSTTSTPSSLPLQDGWTSFIGANGESFFAEEGRIMVRFSGTESEARIAVTSIGGTLEHSPLEGWWSVGLPAGISLKEGTSSFLGLVGVEIAEPVAGLTVSAVPNDTFYTDQWQYKATHHDFEGAWNSVTGLAQTTIAFVDSGIDITHADLAGVYGGGTDIVDGDTDPTEISATCAPGDSVNYGHGTYVAGLLGAQTNNAVGVAGGSWNHAGLLAVRAIPPCGLASTDAIAEGIVWATNNGADVILVPAQTEADTTLLHDAVKYAWERGALVVASAGNDGSTISHFPGAYDEALNVGAAQGGIETPQVACRASYSNYGASVDIFADGGEGGSPANQMVSTDWDGVTTDLYGRKFGTSVAAAVVAGAAALAYEAHHHAGTANLAPVVKNEIIKTAVDHTGDAACSVTPGVPTYLNTLGAIAGDTTAPNIVSALSTSQNSFDLFFDEPLDPATVIVEANWTLSPDNWRLREVKMAPEGTRVTFITWNQALSTTYTITGGAAITDLAGNSISGGTNATTFVGQTTDNQLVYSAYGDGTGGTAANAIDGSEVTEWAAISPTCIAFDMNANGLNVVRVRILPSVFGGGGTWAANVYVGIREVGPTPATCTGKLNEESYNWIGSLSEADDDTWVDFLTRDLHPYNVLHIQYTSTVGSPSVKEVESFAVNDTQRLLVATGQNGVATDSYFKIFESVGDEVLSQRAWYWPGELGQAHIAAGDLTGDGWDEIVIGDGYGGTSYFKVFDSTGAELAREQPYFNGNNPNGEIMIDVGDPDGDGVGEIVACTGERGAASCSFFEFVPGTKTMRPETDLITTYYRPCLTLDDAICDATDQMPWGRYYSNEVHPAFADYDRDGDDEIVLVHGDDGRNSVAIKEMCTTWDVDSGIACLTRTRAALTEWYPYNLGNNPDGEVHIAVGHFTDNYDQIVVAQGIGSSGMVKVNDLDGNSLVSSWQPYNSFLNPNMEIQVMACDLDGDGFDEVITATGEGGNTSAANWLVNVYSVDTGTPVLDATFQPFSAAENPSGEIHIACGKFL